MRPIALTAVATAVLAATPGTAAADLPRVTVSGRVFERQGVVAVSGRDCRPSGLGHGYVFDLEAGIRRTVSFDGEDTKPDGTWRARVPLPVTAARYKLIARCFEKKMWGDDYPAETLTVLPERNPVAEGTLTVRPAVVSPGDTVRVSGRIEAPEYAPGLFLLPSRTYLGPMTLASDKMSASGSVRLPRRLAPGTYRVVAQTTGGDNKDGKVAYVGTVRVVADEPTRAATTAPPAPRPRATPSAKPTPSPTTASPVATVGPSPEPSVEPPSPQPPATVAVGDADDGLGAGRVAAAGAAAALALAGSVFVVRRRRRA